MWAKRARNGRGEQKNSTFKCLFSAARADGAKNITYFPNYCIYKYVYTYIWTTTTLIRNKNVRALKICVFLCVWYTHTKTNTICRLMADQPRSTILCHTHTSAYGLLTHKILCATMWSRKGKTGRKGKERNENRATAKMENIFEKINKVGLQRQVIIIHCKAFQL